MILYAYTTWEAYLLYCNSYKNGSDHVFVCVFCITCEFMKLFRKEKAYKKLPLRIIICFFMQNQAISRY